MKKIFITIVGCISLAMLFVSAPKVNATSSGLEPSVEAKITSVDGTNGYGSTQTKVVEHKEVPNLNVNSRTTSSFEKKYETTIEVDYFFSENYARSTNTGSSNNGIAKASITLTYWISGNTIKVEKCSGSWSKSSSTSIVVSDRYVTYKGPNAKQTGWKYPNSNSFSYNTGWGYASQNTAGNGRAYMSAYTSFSGMGKVFLEAALNI